MPRVLIFGQAFNDFSGGGITLSNLFRGWHKSELAVVSYPFMLHNASVIVCDNYYQIGSDELTWRFPLSMIKRPFSSGRLLVKTSNLERLPLLKEEKSFRNVISENFLTPFLKWTNLVHSVSSIHLSVKLKEWLSEFNPEVLYLQLSNLESINFAIELVDYLKIPTIIHMMDDWPATISSHGLFRKFWRKRIDLAFRILLDNSDIYLGISDAMSAEYLRRYGKFFQPFHNPIDPERFIIKVAYDRFYGDIFRILYIGRIGTANKKSLFRFASFITKYKPEKKHRIEFDIFSKDINSYAAKKLSRNRGIRVMEAISQRDIPSLLKSYDLLLLPLDFSELGLRFSKLSMPTKASEYMMSGTPILVFAPAETAIAQFCLINACGHCVTSLNRDELTESLDLLIGDRAYRERLSLNAQKIASRVFNVNVVSTEFRRIFTQLTMKGDHSEVQSG